MTKVEIVILIYLIMGMIVYLLNGAFGLFWYWPIWEFNFTCPDDMNEEDLRRVKKKIRDFSNAFNSFREMLDNNKLKIIIIWPKIIIVLFLVLLIYIFYKTKGRDKS